MRRLHPRGAASRGIAVDAEGAMLGPDCVLVRRTTVGYRCLSRDQATDLQAALFTHKDPDWLFRQSLRIAKALDANELVLAQIYGLQIPIGELDKRQLLRLAAAAPLIKTNFNPDEPRVPAGNPDGGEWTSEGGTEPEGSQIGGRHDGWPGPAAGATAAAGETAAGSLLGVLPAETLSALTRLAARFNAATAALGTLFLPANRRLITNGAIAGRPDLSYSYNADTGVLRLTQDLGGGRRLFEGHIGADGTFRDAAGKAIGRALAGGSVIVDPDALPGATAGARAGARVGTAPGEPKLCPAPSEEDIIGRSKRALRYQEQITGLPRGLEVRLNGVRFDGCRAADGTMLEAKGPGYAAFMDRSGSWKDWFTGSLETLKEQMKRQSKSAAGRLVEWHFAEKPVADYFRNFVTQEELPNIIVFYTPPEAR